MSQAIQSINKKKSAKSSKKSNRSETFEPSAYIDPPETDIDITTFEKLAIGRLNVLRWVEKQRGLGKPLYGPPSDDRDHREKYLDAILKDNQLSSSQADRVSHFICRIAFCRTDDHRRWFIQQELALFEARYSAATKPQRRKVHVQLSGPDGMRYETLSKHDVLQHDLNDRSPIPNLKPGMKLANEDRMLPLHKVPWSEVPSLVMNRRVYMRHGFAYVPDFMFSNIICGKFRQSLSEALASASRSMDLMKSDVEAMSSFHRINPIVRNLSQMSTTKYQSKSVAGEIRHSDVAEMAPVHFPLCMQNSFDHLAKDHHLKHGARMQFGLFLKAIGLDLRNTHTFFKRMFAAKTPGDKFEKTYGYLWRHQHGVEGNRKNYSPFGCAKIIASQPNRDDHHGCPYKMFDEHNLRQYLRRKGLLDGDVNRILELKKGHHYQIACRTFFEVTHRGQMQKNGQNIEDIESAASWSHPNSYFDLSFSLHHPELAEQNMETMMQQQSQTGPTSGTSSIHVSSHTQNSEIVSNVEPMDIDM